MTKIINVQNVTKSYNKQIILKQINMTVKPGEIYGLIGLSGSGKSTLLRCINGIEKFDSGEIHIENELISYDDSIKSRRIKKRIGMIFQNFALLERKTVFENIALPMKCWKEEKNKTEKRVKELMEFVGISHIAGKKPSQISGGQKQRVAIARALSLSPKILLCDEATSALDPNTTKSILELLKEINRKLNITVIIVTHEMEVVKQIAQKALLLEHGNIIGFDDTEELFLKPDTKMKEFLGEIEIVPTNGVNIKIYFPKDNAFQSFITKMARELDMDFNIVWGKLEEINGHIVGNMVINIEEKDKEIVTNYIKEHDIVWEVL